jgi:hypothetical protein
MQGIIFRSAVILSTSDKLVIMQIQKGNCIKQNSMMNKTIML